MPKILSVGNTKGPKEGFHKSLYYKFRSLDTFIKVTILTMVLIGIATPYIISQTLYTEQKAASSQNTATITINPYAGNFLLGQDYTFSLMIDGGGQAFNAASATVSVSGNMSISSLTVTPASSGGCNFTFVNQNKTPSISNPSFAGAILNGSSSICTLYTMTIRTTGLGGGTITISQGKVKSYENHSEILLSMQSGSYTIATAITPTPTITPLPTVTPTPLPTNTPTPTSTPVPTSQPTPTPSPLVLQAPSINSVPSQTYQNTMILSGTKSPSITKVFVNNSIVNVAYPTSTTWQLPITLTLGINTYSVYGQDASQNNTSSTDITIALHRLADLNGDSSIDLVDLSMFATDWENTNTLNYVLSDMNADGSVDLTDFSIIAKAYDN